MRCQNAKLFLRGPLGPRNIVLAGLAFVFLAQIVGFVQAIVFQEKYLRRPSPPADVLLYARFLVVFLGLTTLGAWLVALLRRGVSAVPNFESWIAVRSFFYCFFAAMGVVSLLAGQDLLGNSGFLLEQAFITCQLAALSLWSAGVQIPLSSWPARVKRRAGFVDLCFGNLLLAAILSEATLGICAHYSNSPLFLNLASIEANLARAKTGVGQTNFNFTLNSGGYHDQEFFAAEVEDHVTAVLGDSFGFGIVPYAYNFVTVAETQLEAVLSEEYARVAVHNFGLPGLGMAEYAYLLEREALSTNPSFVVVCIYVGNDILESRPKAWNYYKFQSSWLWMVARRLLSISKERMATRSMPIAQPTVADGEVPDYIFDSSKESPPLSEETFLRIESENMETLREGSHQVEESYRSFFQELNRIHHLAGTKLLLLLIPDEFQVNDDLYRQLLAMKPGSKAFNRQYPQERIRAYCSQQDIPVLDLLPALREAEQSGRTYHLRDTHWNSRGNRVAGLQMAGFLLQQLSQRGETVYLPSRPHSRRKLWLGLPQLSLPPMTEP